MDKILITLLATLLAAVSLADTAQDAADAAASAQAARLAAIDAKFYADKIVDAQDAASASASEAKTAAAEAKGVKRYLDQEIESALEDIGEAKTTAESAIEAKKDSELAYLQGFATDFEQQIKDGYVTNIVENYTYDYKYDYKYNYQYENYYVTTNVNMTLPTTYEVTYVDGGGKTRSNITVYSEANANGRIYAKTTLSGTSGTTMETLTLRVSVPNLQNNIWQSFPTVEFQVKPSYMDSDINGVRLHFIPTSRTNYSSSSHYIVLNYLYWQNGKFYIRINCYGKSTGNLIAWATGYYDFDANGNTFPNSFTISSGYGRRFTADQNSNDTGGPKEKFNASGWYYRVNTNRASGIWFPSTPAVDDLPTVQWMKTGVLP